MTTSLVYFILAATQYWPTSIQNLPIIIYSCVLSSFNNELILFYTWWFGFGILSKNCNNKSVGTKFVSVVFRPVLQSINGELSWGALSLDALPSWCLRQTEFNDGGLIKYCLPWLHRFIRMMYYSHRRWKVCGWCSNCPLIITKPQSPGVT